jgi:hypothetical protein
MADVASKQQTTALFLSTIDTRTRRHTELGKKKKLTILMGNLCCAREHSVQFFVQLYCTVKLHSLTKSVWGPLDWNELAQDKDKKRALVITEMYLRVS